MVSLLVDGELDEPGRRRVEDHINACDECRETLADFLSLRKRLEGPEVLREPFVQRRSLATILASGSTPPWRRRISVPAAALPAAVLTASVGAFLVGRSLPPAVRDLAPQPPPVVQAQHEDADGLLARFDRGDRAVIAVVPNEYRTDAGGGEP